MDELPSGLWSELSSFMEADLRWSSASDLILPNLGGNVYVESLCLLDSEAKKANRPS